MALSKVDLANQVENQLPQNLVANNLPFRNIIINGDMSQSQRSTSVSSITGSGYNTVDRFRTNMTTAGTWTQSQSTDVPSGEGFGYSLKYDCTTANASLSASAFGIFQMSKLEGQMLQYLKKGTANAESLTISFWVKSSKTGTYIVELFDEDNSRFTNKSYSINSASTWEKKTITFDGDTTGAFNNDNGDSLSINFWLGAGTTFTTGSLQTTWGGNTASNRAVGQVNLADNTANEWYITGVQLEVGTSASDFEFLPYDVNLRRCYRYYEKSYDYETAPATNTEVSSMAINGLDQGTKQLRSVPVKHLETKRATPTVTIYDVPGNSGKINTLDSGGTTATNQSFNGLLANGKNSFNWYIGSTDKEGYIYHYTADAEL